MEDLQVGEKRSQKDKKKQKYLTPKYTDEGSSGVEKTQIKTETNKQTP